MGFGSPLHWVLVLIVVLVLFGRGRISETMGDFGKGIKSFKAGMNDETDRPVPPPPGSDYRAAARPTANRDVERRDSRRSRHPAAHLIA